MESTISLAGGRGVTRALLRKISLGAFAALTSLVALAALALSGAFALSLDEPDYLFSHADTVRFMVAFLVVGLVTGGIALLSWRALRRRLRADYIETRAPRAERRRYERERR